MQTAGEKLITHWQADGLFIQSGVTEDQIQAFERKFHVTLPFDLRAYFL